jgi:hypothetical protein
MRRGDRLLSRETERGSWGREIFYLVVGPIIMDRQSIYIVGSNLTKDLCCGTYLYGPLWLL